MRTISKALVRGASVLFGFAIAATGGVVGIGSAYAQSNECGCLVPAGTPGVVQSVSGSVFVSQANGSVAAQPGMQLQAGNSALVGPQSTSIVGFGGNCTLHLRANTLLEVRPHGGQLCLAVNEQVPAWTGSTAAAGGVGSTAAAGGVGNLVIPGLLLGGLGVGAVAIAVSDKSVSQ